MDDGISEEHPEDVAPTADDLVVTTCNFTFKTYLFCGTDKAQLKHSTHKVLSSVVENKFATVIGDDKTMKDIIDSLSTTIGKGQVFKITQEIKLDTDSDIEKVKDLVGSLSSIDTPISVDYPKTEDKWVDVEDDGPGEISGFIPTVKRLYVGFYPVSLLSTHTEYMNYADSKSDNIVKLYGESYLSSDGEKEIVVDQYTTSAEYYPYVEKFIWNFD